VCQGVFQLFERINIFPGIGAVTEQRLHGPGRKTVEFIVCRIIKTVIIRQLASDDQFLQESLLGGAAGVGTHNFQRYPLGGELAEMQITGKSGLSVKRRIVARQRIRGEPFGKKIFQGCGSGFLAGKRPAAR
jgi:hypothetical protein